VAITAGTLVTSFEIMMAHGAAIVVLSDVAVVERVIETGRLDGGGIGRCPPVALPAGHRRSLILCCLDSLVARGTTVVIYVHHGLVIIIGKALVHEGKLLICSSEMTTFAAHVKRRKGVRMQIVGENHRRALERPENGHTIDDHEIGPHFDLSCLACPATVKSHGTYQSE
jgi:hypothetical protein